VPELHAQNREFVWQPLARPLRVLSAAQARSWDERGFFVLEDAFDAATISEVVAETDHYEQKMEAFLRTRENGQLFIAKAGEITFATHLSARSPLLASFCAHPVFQDLCRELVGPDVRLYWDQAVYKKPEPEREFPWHQDNGYTYVEPQGYLTCWVALSDATEQNGCPWVAPGLHRLGTLQHWTTELGFQCLKDVPDALPAPVCAGGIVVFSSLTPHRTGPNRTLEARKAYIVQFAPDGAVRLEPDEPGVQRRVPCDAPERQFPILVDGRPVAAPGVPA
jgi:ectoine hydroxylase-related dioxygenase (phytanoyl-CoA dioxygenase family)